MILSDLNLNAIIVILVVVSVVVEKQKYHLCHHCTDNSSKNKNTAATPTKAQLCIQNGFTILEFVHGLTHMYSALEWTWNLNYKEHTKCAYLNRMKNLFVAYMEMEPLTFPHSHI